MKRTLVAALVVALAAGALAPAQAAKRKAKPVKTTLYLHGSAPIGETESFSVVADTYLPMDGKKPEGGEPKSKFITNYLVGPNTNCAGNNLFPVWAGDVKGRIKGDMKLTFSAIGTPGQVEVRVWPDVFSSLCNSSNPLSPSQEYPEPAGSAVVDLPPGEGTVEAVIKNVDFVATQRITLQISPVVLVDIPDPGGSLLGPFVSRILYDSADFASSLSFNLYK